MGRGRTEERVVEAGTLGVEREAAEPRVLWLREPVGEAHQRDLRNGVEHEAVAAGLIAWKLLAVK